MSDPPLDDLSADPGWRPALKGLVPFAAMRHGRNPQADGLIGMRLVFVAFCSAVVLIGVVAVVLASGNGIDGSVDSPELVAAFVMFVGIAAVCVVKWLPRRLECSSDDALRKSYTSAFFVRTAVGESAALAGFIGFIATGYVAVYVPGALLCFVAFALNAPTADSLRRLEAQLFDRGCHRSLVKALRTPRADP